MHQYTPLSAENRATGGIGILIYGVVLYLALKSLYLGVKSKSTKRFFVSTVFLSVFEFPRYFALLIEGKYSSRTAYCFHILAGIFFFIAFSIVCRQWSGLLQLGSYFRVVYGIHGLIISNVTFAAVDIVSIVLCATSSTLLSFFSSTGFEVVTFIEGVRNCVYSGFLAYYGVKLVRRFWHFSVLEQQAAAQKRGNAFFGLLLTASGSEGNVFTKVVLRLTSVLVLSSVCFLARLCMLMAKMIAIHSSSQLTSRSFALFGLGWFLLADFVPRALPALAFIFLMRTKRPARDQIKDTNNSFQFARLAGDEGQSDSGGDAYSLGAMPASRVEAMLPRRDRPQTAQRGRDEEDGQTIISFNTMHGGHGGASADEDGGYSDADDEDEDDDDEDGENAIDRFFSILTFSAAGSGAPTTGL